MMRPASNWGLWLAGLVLLHFIVSCGKRCRDTEILPYPEELHAYLKPYKLGSWWVYGNSSGSRDSVYVTEFNESTMSSGLEGPTCLALPVTKLSLRTTGMHPSETVYLTYRGNRPETGALVIMASNNYEGLTLLRFGFSPGVGFGDASLIDTTIASVPFTEILRVDRNLDIQGATLNAAFIAQNIGIISYITQTDTFTLLDYHIP